jgi:predicted PurR-regulated permease PerM
MLDTQARKLGQQREVITLDIAPYALLKSALAVGLTVLLIKTFSVILVIILGGFLAVSLEPIVKRLEGLGIRRNLSIAMIAMMMAGLISIVCLVIMPSAFNQISALIKSFPELKQSFMAHLPEDGPIKATISQALNNPKIPDSGALMAGAASFLNLTFEGLTEVLLVLIFSIYLLVDGKRTFKWLSDFFSKTTKAKIYATAKEASTVIHGYVIGQMVTSIASFIYVYASLSILHVPGALTLGILSGILDVLPILGFFLAVVPAMLLALTISPLCALGVVALYILYHTIENYLIVPFVYGNSMKISSLVVLVALLVAGTVGGIHSVIAVLPIVASYPIIERIWLSKFLGRQVIAKHAFLTENEGEAYSL